MALVALGSYRDPIDAELAKMRLQNAGIPAIVVDQHLISMQWLYSGALGGVKIKVDESDLEIARNVLREDRSADLSSIPESQTPFADGEGVEVPLETLEAEQQVHEARSYFSALFASLLGLAVLYYVWAKIHSPS